MEIIYPEQGPEQEITPAAPEPEPLTEEEEIEMLAGLFFTKEEIAVIMYAENNPFLKGRLKAEAEVRKSIFAMAAAGSTPAQNMALNIIQEAKMKEV